MGNISTQFILSLCIILIGYICKRASLITEQDGEGLSRIIFNLTLPALVINTFSTITVERSLILLPFIAVVYGVFMALIGFLVFRKYPNHIRGMLSMMLPGFNIGLFAYPLVEATWGQKGLKYFGMLDMGNALLVFGVCFFLGSYFSPEGDKFNIKTVVKKICKSIPLIVYILTLAINITGLHYPGIILDISKILSRANMPLSLLLLGIYLSFSFEKSYWNNMLKVLSLRYIIGFLVSGILYFILPFDHLFKATLLIGLILPVGMVVIPYSVQFNYDKRFVGTLANLMIVLSFVIVWLIMVFIN